MIKTSSIKRIIAISIAYSALLSAYAVAGSENRWQNIGYSVSGLAKMTPARNGAAHSFLGVVDGKHSSDPRTVLINLDSQFSVMNIIDGKVPVIAWQNGYPSDLSDVESVAAIPNGKTGAEQQFVAATSDGHFWRFTVNNDSNPKVVNVVEGDKRLQREGSNSSAKEIESVAFFTNSNSGHIKLVWAGRGSRDHSARLFAADLENNTNSIGYNDDNDFTVQETHFNWPRPVWSDDGDTRLISDLKVATSPNGSVFVSSAFDGGNHGPFGSVLYNIGTFQSASDFDSKPSPYPPLTPLFIRGDGDGDGKKVEAIEMLTGNPNDGFILGTDDEKLGGYIIVLK